ncbi:uncharacterized protein LOC108672823 [Hyalella azteca]|uniref:Uncharacterized protein LOC108672823 n=1 Tax=Hyalella azteca TaxID=294128 RepID=A0A8B7NQT5_HYAAZ|nr:uncharacterized protein LOC108672823 [Hyalella azteca]
MSQDGVWSRDITERLIDLYREAPCLWQVKSSIYKDRILRIQALEKISKELEKLDTSINIEKIRKKIHTLRCQFRTEMNKKNEILKSGACADAEDRFIPRLWCFNLLSFLTDEDEKRPSISSLDEMESSASTPTTSNENETSLMFSDALEVPSNDSTCLRVHLPNLEDVEGGNTSAQKGQFDSSGTAEQAIIRPAVQPQRVTRSPTPTSDSSLSQPNAPKSVAFKERPALNKVQKRKRAEDSEAEILQMVATLLKEAKEDEFSIWGRSMANDLAKVDRHQCIIAKKLISETIFYASLNMLQPNTGFNDLKTT